MVVKFRNSGLFDFLNLSDQIWREIYHFYAIFYRYLDNFRRDFFGTQSLKTQRAKFKRLKFAFLNKIALFYAQICNVRDNKKIAYKFALISRKKNSKIKFSANLAKFDYKKRALQNTMKKANFQAQNKIKFALNFDDFLQSFLNLSKLSKKLSNLSARFYTIATKFYKFVSMKIVCFCTKFTLFIFQILLNFITVCKICIQDLLKSTKFSFFLKFSQKFLDKLYLFWLECRLLLNCGNSSVVERDLAMVDVASSTLVSRSIFFNQEIK